MAVAIPVMLEKALPSDAVKEGYKNVRKPEKSEFAQSLDQAVKKNSQQLKREPDSRKGVSSASKETSPPEDKSAQNGAPVNQCGTFQASGTEENTTVGKGQEEMLSNPAINQPTTLDIVSALRGSGEAVGSCLTLVQTTTAAQGGEGQETSAPITADNTDVSGTSAQNDNIRTASKVLPSTDGNNDASKGTDMRWETAPEKVPIPAEKLLTQIKDAPLKVSTTLGENAEAYLSALVRQASGTPTQANETDVKIIMTMQDSLRPDKVAAKGEGQPMDPEDQSEPRQDKANFILLTNHNDNLTTRAADSKSIQLQSKEQVDAKDLIQQIVQKAEVMLKSEVSEMRMQLKPEFLGKMLIKVTVEEGNVITKIITENQQVKQMLEANLNSLRQSLEASGIKVEKTEVSVQLFNDGSGSFSQSDSNRYMMWSEQQSQNRRSYSQDHFGYPEMENVPESIEATTNYGMGLDGQVDYLI